MNYLRISFGIFLVLAASRFIPHPPNFTSLIALSFYVPAFLGRKYMTFGVISSAFSNISNPFNFPTYIFSSLKLSFSL